MSIIDGLAPARAYNVPTTREAGATLIWPIISNDGPLALLRIDLEERPLYSTTSDTVANEAVTFLKTHLANKVENVLVAEYVKGELAMFSNVWVSDQSESHQEFALIWNYTLHTSLLEMRGLPQDLLDYPFPAEDLPPTLALTQQQQEGLEARTRAEDTSTLLYCLEGLQDVMSRRPHGIRIQVSEETAIGLLAIHGASAVRALEGIERFPD
jgi:hypothetical protein